MIGDTAGFVILKSNANCKFAVGKADDWTNGIKLAVEINHRSKSVLLISDAQMGMFDFADVDRMFECCR